MGDGQPWNLPNVTYGFIGIGVMGYPMAQNLRRRIPRQARLIVREINESAVRKFLAETSPGDQIFKASTPKEVAEQADIIITMLPKGPHVELSLIHI